VPIYEYQCKKCGHAFEKLVRSMSDKSAALCPECGSKKTGKALSAFAVGGQGGSARTPRKSAHQCCGGCCGGARGACPIE
jgi:putative FmdB family regulatory protein